MESSSFGTEPSVEIRLQQHQQQTRKSFLEIAPIRLEDSPVLPRVPGSRVIVDGHSLEKIVVLWIVLRVRAISIFMCAYARLDRKPSPGGFLKTD